MTRLIRQTKASPVHLPDISRRAWQCVSHSGARPNLGRLAVLPPEMMLEVTRHLDEASQFSLALTCRTFFAGYLPPTQSMGHTTRQQLLILVEKDVPGLFYCFHCNKLHPWKRDGWVYRHDREFYFHSAAMRDCKDHSLWTKARIWLPYIVARLIMNRHFLGHDHGLDLGFLHFTDTVSEDCGSQRSMAWDAKIVDDELFMICTTTMWHKNGDAQVLRRFIEDRRRFVEDRRHFVCAHLVTHNPGYTPPDPWPGHGYSMVKQLDELAEGASDQDCFVACRGSTRSCPKCMTDYCIDIRGDKGEGWKIKIVAYYNLGSLRSPKDWKWEALVDPKDMTAAPRMSRDLAESGPGMVRHKWASEDDMNLVPEGEWVQLWYYRGVQCAQS